MTALIWDKPGEKVYQTGVDRGVLYLQDGSAVVWNGLTSVEDTTSKETSSYYLDGIKYLEYISPGDFSANLKAFTYPAEFDEVNGIAQPASGINVYDQPSKSFNLSYRTKIGDDLLGVDAGYLLHILYNVLANSDSHEYSTISQDSSADEFSWVLSAKPVKNSSNLRPTSHLSLDSREISAELLQAFEDTIYGTAEAAPSLPTLDNVISFFLV